MKKGDYVRTQFGIGRIEQIEDNSRIVIDYNNPVASVFTDSIIKSSPNIIDLIEVGDYVNGYYVEDIRQVYDGETITILEVASGSNYFQTPIYDDDIKSIVTKEKFELIEYRIGE